MGDPTFQRLEDLALVEDDVLVFTDLETATTYELVVTSADRHGNPSTMSTTFTTLTAALPPPSLLALRRPAVG